MLILGIETSCDDTSVAVLKIENDKPEVLSNVVSSQVKIHSEFGGVVPILAAREHEKNLPIVLQSALDATRYTLHDIDLLAVTSGPGLIMSLVKGVNFAKELAKQYNKPIVGVNHLEGHIYSAWLDGQKPLFPALSLSVAGGHTDLILVKDYGKYEKLGQTVDDAAGEAFDKIARMLGLAYPGGPEISKEAEKFSGEKTITLPRPMIHSKDLNFSFSGLKTSVLYLIRDLKVPLDSVRSEIAHEAQEAIVDVLIAKTKKAIELYQPKSVLLAGGVSANRLLREKIKTLHSNVFIPPMEYTTDNAAMIAMAAYFNQDTKDFDADANWEIV